MITRLTFFSAALLACAALGVAGVPGVDPTDAPAAKREAEAGKGQPDPTRGDEFARMDTDHDGRVSPAEYAASDREAVARIAAGMRNGPAGATGGFDFRNSEGRPDRTKIFRRWDSDRDGYISRGELESSGRGAAEAGGH